MFYGIEQSTDPHHPNTKIEKFSSEVKARAWKNKGGFFTFPLAASIDIPPRQQNWHHTYRFFFKSKGGFRLDQRTVLKKQKDESKRLLACGCGINLPTKEDIAIEMIRQNCDEMK